LRSKSDAFKTLQSCLRYPISISFNIGFMPLSLFDSAHEPQGRASHGQGLGFGGREVEGGRQRQCLQMSRGGLTIPVGFPHPNQMDNDLGPRLIAAEHVGNAVVIMFADGKCAIYSASLLYDTLPRAEAVPELDEKEEPCRNPNLLLSGGQS
jgi:hypothetical protein